MKMNAEHFFRELKRDITTYGELKFELLKVGTYERTGKVIAVLAYGLILLILGFFLSLFVFLTLDFVKTAVITALLVICIGCRSLPKSDKVIKGNGKIETKSFPESDFNAVCIKSD